MSPNRRRWIQGEDDHFSCLGSCTSVHTEVRMIWMHELQWSHTRWLKHPGAISHHLFLQKDFPKCSNPLIQTKLPPSEAPEVLSLNWALKVGVKSSSHQQCQSGGGNDTHHSQEAGAGPWKEQHHLLSETWKSFPSNRQTAALNIKISNPQTRIFMLLMSDKWRKCCFLNILFPRKRFSGFSVNSGFIVGFLFSRRKPSPQNVRNGVWRHNYISLWHFTCFKKDEVSQKHDYK